MADDEEEIEDLDDLESDDIQDEEIQDDSYSAELVSGLMDTYKEELLAGVTTVTVLGALEAAKDSKSSLTRSELNRMALKQSEKWYTDLVKRGGSFVVEDHEDLAFTPWLDDLESELTDELSQIITDAVENKWTEDQINKAIEKLKTKGLNRSRLAAEYELLRNVDQIRKNVWKKSGVKRLLRHSAGAHVCGECTLLSGRIFDLGDAPPIPAHHACRCYYTITYDKEV